MHNDENCRTKITYFREKNFCKTGWETFWIHIFIFKNLRFYKTFVFSELWDLQRHLYFLNFAILRDIQFWNGKWKFKKRNTYFGEKNFCKNCSHGNFFMENNLAQAWNCSILFLYTQDFWIWEIHTVLLQTAMWSRVSKLTISPRCIHHWPSTMLQQCLPWHPIKV